MNKKLLTDAGESYVYIKTIVESKVELAKINAAQTTSKMMGAMLLFTILGITALLILLAILASVGFLFATMYNSFYIGVLAFCLPILIIAVCIFFFRKKIIYKPITNFIYSHVLDEI